MQNKYSNVFLTCFNLSAYYRTSAIVSLDMAELLTEWIVRYATKHISSVWMCLNFYLNIEYAWWVMWLRDKILLVSPSFWTTSYLILISDTCRCRIRNASNSVIGFIFDFCHVFTPNLIFLPYLVFTVHSLYRKLSTFSSFILFWTIVIILLLAWLNQCLTFIASLSIDLTNNVHLSLSHTVFPPHLFFKKKKKRLAYQSVNDIVQNCGNESEAVIVMPNIGQKHEIFL